MFTEAGEMEEKAEGGEREVRPRGDISLSFFLIALFVCPICLMFVIQSVAKNPEMFHLISWISHPDYRDSK